MWLWKWITIGVLGVGATGCGVIEDCAGIAELLVLLLSSDLSWLDGLLSLV